jgi:hypothetical protein
MGGVSFMREDLIKVRFYKDGGWKEEILTLTSAAMLLSDLQQIFAQPMLAQQDEPAKRLKILVD